MRFVANTRRGILPICITVAVAAMAPATRALPPDPGNAALLYYQAFISLPNGRGGVRGLTEGLPCGADPNEQIRKYLKQCQSAFDLVEDASHIAACDWGFSTPKASRCGWGSSRRSDR